jgi:hypothetical protein
MNFFSYDNVIALQEMIFHALYRKLAETHDPLQYGPYNGTVPVGFRERVAGSCDAGGASSGRCSLDR